MGCFAVFISVFYLIGFSVLGYGLWSARQSTQAAGWPITQGVLTHVDLKRQTSREGPTYEVNVEYVYTVDGQEYRGDRLAFGYTASNGREAHAEIYDKLKAAKSVEVRYDPRDPATSVLSYGIHRTIKLVIAFGITWLAFTLGFTLLFWVSSRGDVVLLKNLSVH